jgi:uncharacterized membrane protein
MNVAAPALLPRRKDARFLLLSKLVGFALLLAVALFFVAQYVFRYYLHYDEASFTDPLRGAANYWSMRGWLLLHITSGMVALLTGPWQFWTGFRQRFWRIHRWTGRTFLIAVAIGSLCAFRLAFATTFGWAFGVALFFLAATWASTAGMAYLAILKGKIEIHKEWMVRAYVVTFAFVTFRLLNDYPPLSHLEPGGDRIITIGWASWVVPLMISEVIMQIRRLHKESARA